MRPRLLFVIVVAALLLGVSALLLSALKAESTTRATETIHKPPTEASKNATSPGVPGRKTLSTVSEADGDEHAYFRWYIEEVRRNPRFEGEHPLNFWGKVHDEEDRPIVGASVRCEWSDLSKDGTSAETLMSDQSGAFALLQRKGKFLTVQVSKPGYHSLGTNSARGFEMVAPYERFRPDPKSPVVFRLKKGGIAEPLIAKRQFIVFATNDIPQGIDLLRGELVQTNDADLLIRFNRDSQRTNGAWRWSASLTVPNGGIVECGAADFLAPESGYSPEINYKLEIDDPTYSTTLDKVFFVRLRGGQYFGKIKMTLSGIWRNQSAVDYRCLVNPNGSRNLEFDRKLQEVPPSW